MGIPCSKVKKSSKTKSNHGSTQIDLSIRSNNQSRSIKPHLTEEEKIVLDFDEGEKHIRTDFNDRLSADGRNYLASPIDPMHSISSAQGRSRSISIDYTGLDEAENYLQLDPLTFKGKSLCNPPNLQNTYV